MAAEPADVSEDGILGGRLVLRQPLKGHRVGHDAVLLAAATSVRPGDLAVELGAGVGAAGLAVARRVDDLAVTLVEIEPTLTALARENAARNQLAERVHALCLDVAAPPEVFVAAGLAAAAADHVLMNPPFNAAQNPSPERGRRLAHEATPDSLTRWAETAAWLLRPAGIVTLIWRADRLDEALAALSADFGALGILPVHPKPGAPAIRVLVRAVKASRASLTLLPGFFLSDEAGKPTAQAEAVLREGAVLRLAAVTQRPNRKAPPRRLWVGGGWEVGKSRR
jgi:tRNA1(Val) A37 N6-methylase TrmN6